MVHGAVFLSGQKSYSRPAWPLAGFAWPVVQSVRVVCCVAGPAWRAWPATGAWLVPVVRTARVACVACPVWRGPAAGPRGPYGRCLSSSWPSCPVSRALRGLCQRPACATCTAGPAWRGPAVRSLCVFFVRSKLFSKPSAVRKAVWWGVGRC